MTPIVTYQYNGSPSHTGGSSLWERSKDLGTEEPSQVRVVFDRRGFLDGRQAM